MKNVTLFFNRLKVMELSKLFEKKKTPQSLKYQAMDNLMHHKEYVYNNFDNIPFTLKKEMVEIVLEKDSIYKQNDSPLYDTDWTDANLSLEQYFDVIYSNVVFDCDCYYFVMWMQNNGVCRFCATDYQTYYRDDKRIYLCSEEHDVESNWITAEEVEELVFDINNWCSRCLIKPLFCVKFEEELTCEMCQIIDYFQDYSINDLIDKYGQDYVRKMYIKHRNS